MNLSNLATTNNGPKTIELVPELTAIPVHNASIGKDTHMKWKKRKHTNMTNDNPNYRSF